MLAKLDNKKITLPGNLKEWMEHEVNAKLALFADEAADGAVAGGAVLAPAAAAAAPAPAPA